MIIGLGVAAGILVAVLVIVRGGRHHRTPVWDHRGSGEDRFTQNGRTGRGTSTS